MYNQAKSLKNIFQSFNFSFMFTFDEHIRKLAEFGHIAQLTGTYNTKDYPEGMILSDNPEKSHIPPSFISIPDVQTLKYLCGISNTIASSDVLTPDLPESPDMLNYEIINPLDEHVCDALNEYVYGNSNQVAAWESTLNKLRFPMQVAVFSADTIVVNAGKPLYIGENNGKPVTPTLANIVIEAGGQIISRNSGVVTIRQLTSQATAEDMTRFAANPNDPSLFSVGSDGGKGGDGGDGANNTGVGSKGPDATENGKSGCNAAGDGGRGNDGGNASPTTGKGGCGSPASPINYNVSTMNGNFTVGSVGGKGGPGGKGGNGGNAGDGGPGGAGKGGDGGPGCKVYINYSDGNPKFSVSNLKADGGCAGKAGTIGNGGKGNPPGDNGKPGATVDGGSGGAAGQVIINGVVTD
jgi:hypothetical protein